MTEKILKSYFLQAKRKHRLVKKPLSRLLHLHPSTFPYCGLRHLYERLNGESLYFTEDFSSLFYMNIGTVIHTLIQEWVHTLPNCQIIGNWECSCGKQFFNCTVPECHDLRYIEMPVSYGRYIRGYLDGLLKTDKGLYVIDYKTTGLKAFPNQSNIQQVNAYTAIKDASGWLLCYISRNNMELTILEQEVPSEKRESIKILLNTYNQWFHKACYPRSHADIQFLIESKPCKTEADYYANYQPCWSNSPCPLLKDCFSPNLREKLFDLFKPPRIVSLNKPHDVPLNKPPWDNPFINSPQSILKYENWLLGRLVTNRQPPSIDEILSLKGLTLGCPQYPNPSHADLLVRLCSLNY